MTLAQELPSAGFWDLVSKGGPFVVAAVVIVVLMLAVWKLVAKPAIDGFVAVSLNLEKTANSMQQAAASNSVAATENRACAAINQNTAATLDKLMARHVDRR